MYCPTCRTEYREGFETCADCNVALVHELPPEPKRGLVEFEEVYATRDHIEIAVLKSFLDQEQIPFYFNNLNDAYRFLFQPAVLWVLKEKAERVREIIEEARMEARAMDGDDFEDG